MWYTALIMVYLPEYPIDYYFQVQSPVVLGSILQPENTFFHILKVADEFLDRKYSELSLVFISLS